MPEMLIPYIAWEIQLTCNMGCEFCYSSSYNRFRRGDTREQPPLEELIRDLTTLQRTGLGVEVINWSGGEPLLRHKDLRPLFKAAAAVGISNVLSTNGMFSAIPALGHPGDQAASNARFERFLLEELSPYLDWLSISWDSADRSINNEVMRRAASGRAGSPHHFDDVLSIVEIFRRRMPPTTLKINTLITAANYGDSVVAIGRHLQGLEAVWKLVQFNPRECPPDFRDRHRVSTEDFRRLVDRIRNTYEGKPGYEHILIATREYDGSDAPYCFLVVNTSGHVLLPIGEKHVVLAELRSHGRAVSPEQVHDEIEQALQAAIAGSSLFRGEATEHGLPLLQYFSHKNRCIFEHSYTFRPLELRGLRLS